MTISEIIARFTRSGIMPVKDYYDQGGNSAPEDPEFDPMDFDPDYWKNEVNGSDPPWMPRAEKWKKIQEMWIKIHRPLNDPARERACARP